MGSFLRFFSSYTLIPQISKKSREFSSVLFSTQSSVEKVPPSLSLYTYSIETKKNVIKDEYHYPVKLYLMIIAEHFCSIWWTTLTLRVLSRFFSSNNFTAHLYITCVYIIIIIIFRSMFFFVLPITIYAQS